MATRRKKIEQHFDDLEDAYFTIRQKDTSDFSSRSQWVFKMFFLLNKCCLWKIKCFDNLYSSSVLFWYFLSLWMKHGYIFWIHSTLRVPLFSKYRGVQFLAKFASLLTLFRFKVFVCAISPSLMLMASCTFSENSETISFDSSLICFAVRTNFLDLTVDWCYLPLLTSPFQLLSVIMVSHFFWVDLLSEEHQFLGHACFDACPLTYLHFSTDFKWPVLCLLTSHW